MGNSFGQLLRLTTFGESHGPAIGGVLDGVPAGLRVETAVREALARRRPGENLSDTARREPDQVEFLSGLYQGETTGAPLAFLIRNCDVQSHDYDSLKDVFRPSHADYTYEMRYGRRDPRGGGRASARETAVRVAAGAVARLILPESIRIEAFTTAVGTVSCPIDPEDLVTGSAYSAIAAANRLHCPDTSTAARMEALLSDLRAQGDSAGGKVHVSITGVPAGWGDPVFGKLHACLGAAILSIPACKGFSYGSGFDTTLKGSQANDAFYPLRQNNDGPGSDTPLPRLAVRTNHSGGIQGGISNGAEIHFDAAFKPIPSIALPQPTVRRDGSEVCLQIKGRHDVSVLPRVLPVVEAMTALTLADAFLLSKTYL